MIYLLECSPARVFRIRKKINRFTMYQIAHQANNLMPTILYVWGALVLIILFLNYAAHTPKRNPNKP